MKYESSPTPAELAETISPEWREAAEKGDLIDEHAEFGPITITIKNEDES